MDGYQSSPKVDIYLGNFSENMFPKNCPICSHWTPHSLSLSLSLSLIASFSVRLDKDLKTEPDVSNESNVSLGSWTLLWKWLEKFHLKPKIDDVTATAVVLVKSPSKVFLNGPNPASFSQYNDILVAQYLIIKAYMVCLGFEPGTAGL